MEEAQLVLDVILIDMEHKLLTEEEALKYRTLL
jgi:hypothetical protein